MRNNCKGLVLIMALMMAGASAIVASAILSATTSRLRNVSRAHSFEQAFFIADAGVQRAAAQLKTDGGFAPVRLGPDGQAGTDDDGIFAFGASESFAGGAYTVRAVGNFAIPPGTDVDSNNILVVHSAGIFNNAGRVIEAAFYFEPDVILPQSTNINATPISYWENFVNGLMPYADLVILQNRTISSGTELGTLAEPRIVVVEHGAVLQCTGRLAGAGILIIKDGGGLKITGQFQYDGLVIAVGTGAQDLARAGNAIIRGAVVCISANFTETSSSCTTNVAYSSLTLNNLDHLDFGNGDLRIGWWREMR